MITSVSVQQVDVYSQEDDKVLHQLQQQSQTLLVIWQPFLETFESTRCQSKKGQAYNNSSNAARVVKEQICNVANLIPGVFFRGLQLE